ncbi:MAG: PQ-loop repeat-containing protein [Bacteroidales bacterium]|nr:PQ-loop repeat-containing protein [Bacteroidales bacterium]
MQKQQIKKFITSLGWFGNILLSIGVFPQVVLTWRTHDVESFSWSFLLMWAIGVFLTFIYILFDNIQDKKFQYPLLLNYLVNILGTFYLVFAKFMYS